MSIYIKKYKKIYIVAPSHKTKVKSAGLYVVSPVKKKKQERSFGNLPTLIFLDNEQVHPVRSMDSPKFFLSRLGHNSLFLKVAN